MYFIVPKTSETGKKFQAIEDKAQECLKQIDTIIDRFGVEQYCTDRWAAFGGLEILIFPQQPDLKLWKPYKKFKNAYTPNLKYKEGKALKAEFKSLLTVSKHELNQVVGFGGAPFNSIGFAYSHDEYFGFSAKPEWGIKIPEDCTEVTYTKYQELFTRK